MRIMNNILINTKSIRNLEDISLFVCIICLIVVINLYFTVTVECTHYLVKFVTKHNTKMQIKSRHRVFIFCQRQV